MIYKNCPVQSALALKILKSQQEDI